MSLDVYLTVKGARRVPGSGIFIREYGEMRQLTREEWDQKHPGCEPVIAAPAEDVVEDDTVFTANVTHNLTRMADEAGIYKHLWRPDELGITKARELIEPLRAGLELMRAEPARFKAHNPENGWGSYDRFVPWVASYLSACEEYPDADVSVWR